MRYFEVSIYCVSAILISIGIYYFISFLEFYPWPTYADPYGRYTFHYPPDLRPIFSRIKESPVYLDLGPPDIPGLAKMRINSTTSERYVNLSLEGLKNLSIFENSHLLPTFRIVDPPSYSKYEIDGKPTVSYSFDYGYGGKTKELYIGIIKNNRLFQVGYWAGENHIYGNYLPTVEKIIHSMIIS